ncbi:uncharacterized protein LOC124272539 [Haliotis rubra]|uniref:uncharacterized protein LOC124272539 n=1 Tax=Haliotis rubra TaxID=36100 RepID=UPI001EE60A5B|nr:uncharacterized protein LOC124272539 [Haliotis rubra]
MKKYSLHVTVHKKDTSKHRSQYQMAGVYEFCVLYLLWVYGDGVSATASPCDTVSWSVVSPSQPLHQGIKTDNLLQCMHVCKYIPRCNSVTYDVSRRDCALHDEPGQPNEPQKKIFNSICELATAVHGPCDDNPCNNVQCIPIGATYICLDILQCLVTASPENGNMTYHGHTALSRRQLVCDEGYEPTGATDGTCTTDGTWDNAGVTCKEIDCGIPPAVTGASVDYTATVYGSTTTYTCNAWMSFPGGTKAKTASCSLTGSWTRIENQCESDVVLIDGWVLVFRISAGINVFSYDVWMNSSIYHDYPADRDDVMPGCRSINSSLPCDLHFRSKILNEWSSLNISQVKVLLIAGSKEKATIVFNGKDSDKENWFTSSRVSSSTWTGLGSSRIFRINGWRTRRFYINYFLGKCTQDSGWLVVLDSEPVCSEYTFPNGPTIMYSPLAEKSLISTEYKKADAMAILVKLDSL